ncbi:hypothetical protein GCM10025866_25770 [Naasia aerilata]|uniref:ER-bound oxygenase mpaB/mpaB'/Rubber oxygenase catalytic domain-containing protein n=1 Tax=Naasia aerilata TaxID=1162966 RepID=A0ABN6XR63_9MICO|nr:hypothetical protein GCM10025866_25770 [Naasia aerilata]
MLAFGTEEEIRRVARSVGVAHRGVQGDEPVRYDARDPELQLWVAATLYDTTVQVWEAVHGPLPEATADAVYRESARIGTALGMPLASWPTDRAAFREYWEQRVARLEVTPPARAVAVSLLRPRTGPMWLRGLMPLARVVTAGLLPEAVRRGYGVRWDDRLGRQFARRFGLLLAVYRILPRTIRRAPSRLLLARFRGAAPASTPS